MLRHGHDAVCACGAPAGRRRLRSPRCFDSRILLAIVVFLLSLAWSVAARSIPTNKPIDETSQERWERYLWQLIVFTGAFGLVPWCLGCCCFCCWCCYCCLAGRSDHTHFRGESKTKLDDSGCGDDEEGNPGGVGNVSSVIPPKHPKAAAVELRSSASEASPEQTRVTSHPSPDAHGQKDGAAVGVSNEERSAEEPFTHFQLGPRTGSRTVLGSNSGSNWSPGRDDRRRVDAHWTNEHIVRPSLQRQDSFLRRAGKHSVLHVKKAVAHVEKALSRKMERDTHHIWTFWVPAFVILSVMGICFAVIVARNDSLDSNVDDAYDGVERLLDGTAEFFCADKKNPSVCENNTIGAFVGETVTETNEVVDRVVASLALIVQPADDVAALTDAADLTANASESLSALADTLNNNSATVNNLLDMLRTPSFAGSNFTDTLRASYMPRVSKQELTDTQQAAQDVIKIAEDSLDPAYAGADDDLRLVIEDLNTTVRSELVQYLRELQDSMREISTALVVASDDMDSSQGTLDKALFVKTVLIGVFFSIPVLCYACGAGGTTMSNRHKACCLTTNLWFLCTFFIVYCVAIGFFLFVRAINEDTCDATEDFIVVNTQAIQFRVGDSHVNLSDSIINVLECGVGFNKEPNFAAAFNIEEEFNVSEYFDADIRKLRRVALDFNQTLPVKRVEGNSTLIKTLLGNEPDVETFAIAELEEDLDALLTSLPPLDERLDRANATQQFQLYTNYGLAPAGGGGAFNPWPFDWDDYTANISQLNALVGNMTSIPPGYGYAWNENSIQRFTLAIANATNSPWLDDARYTGSSTQAADVIDAVARLDSMTATINASAAMNDANRATASDLFDALDTQTTLVDSYEKHMDTAYSADDTLLSTTADLLAFDDDVTDAILANIRRLNALVDFIATAPDYLGCTFIGRFYEDVFRVEVCTDMRDDLVSMSNAMVLLALCIVLGFILFSIAVPVFAADRNYFARRKRWDDINRERAELDLDDNLSRQAAPMSIRPHFGDIQLLTLPSNKDRLPPGPAVKPEEHRAFFKRWRVRNKGAVNVPPNRTPPRRGNGDASTSPPYVVSPLGEPGNGQPAQQPDQLAVTVHVGSGQRQPETVL